MPVDRLRENGEVVRVLAEALYESEHGLTAVPGVLKRVIRENRWQERHIENAQRVATFGEFRRFVESTPPDGLGTDLATVKRICRDDAEALDLIDRATQNRPGRPESGVIHVNREGQGRDRSGQHLRRLRKDFPDAHERVLQGSVSITRAAVEAGVYPRRVSINLQSPTSAASTVLRQADRDYVEGLILALREGLDGEQSHCEEVA